MVANSCKPVGICTAFVLKLAEVPERLAQLLLQGDLVAQFAGQILAQHDAEHPSDAVGILEGRRPERRPPVDLGRLPVRRIRMRTIIATVRLVHRDVGHQAGFEVRHAL